jgi:hypothetical protein
MANQHLLERAFEIAASGTVSTTTELRRQLGAEGFSFSEVAAALEGQHVQGQLRAAIKAARAQGTP